MIERGVTLIDTIGYLSTIDGIYVMGTHRHCVHIFHI